MSNHVYNRTPRAYSVSVAQGHSWTVTGTKPFSYVQLGNEAGHSVYVTLNGDANAVFLLAASTTQIVQADDLDVWSVTLTNSQSGATTATVDVLIGYSDNTAPTTSTT